MTAISNFIQGNFIANSQLQQLQIPIWVINSHKNLTLGRPILSAFLNRCQQDKKPLIHLDLGIHTICKINKNVKQIVSSNAITYVKPLAQIPYYVVKASVFEKKAANFLTQTIEGINQDVNQGELRRDKQQNSPTNYQFGLLIQGIQSWCVLNKGQSHYSAAIQSFINKLSMLSPKIRQIIIYSQSYKLPTQINFLLQRLSTCLTNIISYNQGSWKCLSTVRRYTGYNNQQQYSIVIDANNRVKVNKNKIKKNGQKSKAQIQMVNNLGFSVEKDQQTRLKQQELKQMIFPHLKMRKQNKAGCEKETCNKQGCRTQCKSQQPLPQDLFILDDEQQDDEDVDV